MPNDPSYLGTVDQIAGAEVHVRLDETTLTGLLFVDGKPFYAAQVGSFARIPVGLTDLVGIVTQASASPPALASRDTVDTDRSNDRLWMTVQLVGQGSSGTGFDRGVALLPNIGDAVYVMTE